ncbi:interleukin-7 [Ambystoma mexicanum]|uniref:interleukin-7 n=1 Tax=Ambystoma mexicanum TaxID=8296 RepID=UPI0037E80F47
MLNVFFRYIFGIPPLMLVLLPVGSPTCENRSMMKIKEDYKNVLFLKVQEVMTMSSRYPNEACCKTDKPEERRKYLCNETMEINSLSKMGCALQHLANRTKLTNDFKCGLISLSHQTEEMLSCHCEHKVAKCEGRFIKKRTRCNQKLCVIKKTISSFKSCWEQLMQNGQR